jgi:hypothetical protein
MQKAWFVNNRIANQNQTGGRKKFLSEAKTIERKHDGGMKIKIADWPPDFGLENKMADWKTRWQTGNKMAD